MSAASASAAAAAMPAAAVSTAASAVPTPATAGVATTATGAVSTAAATAKTDTGPAASRAADDDDDAVARRARVIAWSVGAEPGRQFESVVVRLLAQAKADAPRFQRWLARRRRTVASADGVDSKGDDGGDDDGSEGSAEDAARWARHGTFRPPYVKVVGPMVRYSKLPFRLLCHRYGADLTFTPMIVASAFARSQYARDSEFATTPVGWPDVATTAVASKPAAAANASAAPTHAQLFVAGHLAATTAAATAASERISEHGAAATTSTATAAGSRYIVSGGANNTPAAIALAGAHAALHDAKERYPVLGVGGGVPSKAAAAFLRDLSAQRAAASVSAAATLSLPASSMASLHALTDRPVIAQFAANRPDELATAAVHVAPYVDGVDLNCGCPQRWAIGDGLGCGLLGTPQRMSELVRAVHAHTTVPCSVKIRVDDGVVIGAPVNAPPGRAMRHTLDLVSAVERAGVSLVTVHGRTPKQKSSDAVNLQAIAQVKALARVPVLANGDLFRAADCDRMVDATACDGVMSARGALCNPALYAGHLTVPLACAAEYAQLALLYGGAFSVHHHHLMYMLFALNLSKPDRSAFSALRSMAAVADFFTTRGVGVVPAATDAASGLPFGLSHAPANAAPLLLWTP